MGHKQDMKERAARGQNAVKSHKIAIGEKFKVGEIDYTDIASMMTDIRHYCDKIGADFHRVEKLSYQHYLEEKNGE